MTSFRRNVRHVQPGEDVAAGVTSRSTRDLEGNVAYLKELFDLALVGQALFAREVAIDPTLLPGQAVYWNATTARFEAASAVAENDEESGTLVLTAKAEVVGILATKEDAASVGNVLLSGMAEVDLTDALTETATVGWYYLSSLTAGKLTKQRPPVSIPVLFNLGDGRVIVSPSFGNLLNSHVHFEFELVNRPAGTHVPPDLDDPHAEHFITDADSSLPGWLPADDPIFAGAAPSHALFGYNLSQDTALQRVWPPIPLEACSLVLDRPYIPGSVFRMGGTVALKHTEEKPGDYLVDANGIWWFDRRSGNVPWDPTIDSGDPGGESSSSVAGSGHTPTNQRAFLSFAKALFANDKSVVTSLVGVSPIVVTGCNQETASTGALQVAVDFALTTTDDAPAGGLVVKTVDGTSFQRGWAVEGLVAGTGISLSSDNQTEIDEQEVHQGVVVVSSTVGNSALELPAQLIRLDDVEERYYQNLMYLGFPEGRDAAFRARFHIPPAGLATTPTFKLRLLILGRAAGTVPALTLTARRLTRPDGSDEALPLTDSSLAITTTHVLSSSDTYYEVESDELTVAAGDTVYITLSRAGSTDGYASEVGLLRIGGIVG